MIIGSIFRKCLLTVGLFSFLFQGCKPMIIAHRGASAVAPENTKASFTLAWQMKVPAVECDIHLTRDKQVIVIHDQNTKRTAGADVNVNDANYSELSLLDIGSFKNKKYAGERIPLLADIIKTIPADGKLLVEIKCGKEVLPYLQDIIDKSGKRSQIIIIGFNIDVIAESKKLMPDTPVYWLVMPEKDKTGKWLPYSSSLISRAKEKNFEGLDVYWEGLSEKFVQESHNAGLKVYIWTVDDISIAKKLIKMGVDGITSNKADFIMKNI
jgi:glycerophosphoryl diester phosphodiesterase